MTNNNFQKIAALSVIAVFAVSIGVSNAFAEEEENSKYKMADDLSAKLTFTFRDGVETHQFPVFKMTSDLISNVGTTFNVQGVVGDSPHLHKALDDAFKYRLMTSSGSGFEYDYRFFDVEVEISKNDNNTVRNIDYYNCEVLDYKVETLKDDYESYGFYEKVGFAIVDDIDFRCGGVNSEAEPYPKSRSPSQVIYEYDQTSFSFAEDARTIVTLKFDEGTEKIEFPIFELITGFEEGDDAGPVFHVEGAVRDHPLLDNAINQARQLKGLPNSHNTDFEAVVEFINNGKTVRGLDFVDCRVSSFLIDTYQDKEEGYTGKRGFAIVEKLDFACAGLTPLNPTMAEISDDKPVWSTVKMSNEYMANSYNMGTGPHAVVTFTFNDGQETINFPVFEQGDLLDKANPSLELTAVPGTYPLLYKHVDKAQNSGSKSTGIDHLSDLFDVDVNLVYGEESIRKFNYSDCRSVDYVIKTQHDKEESFFKGFSLTNEFHLECKGYHPNSPVYDAMFNTYAKADTTNTTDLRNTDQWPPGFYTQ